MAKVTYMELRWSVIACGGVVAYYYTISNHAPQRF